MTKPGAAKITRGWIIFSVAFLAACGAIAFIPITTPAIPLRAGYSVQICDSELIVITPDHHWRSVPLNDVGVIAIFISIGGMVLRLAWREDRAHRNDADGS